MATGRPIDHVVLAVRDLDQTAAVYERLGFTLTPRAAHEDRMGTSNRIAQFRGRNFIELLEVDRPDLLQRHAFDAPQPFFSFGDHNRLATQTRDGLSLLVFQTDDTRADLSRFAAAGLQTFAPFDFERQAQLPDGTTATVSFSLGFVRSPHMPRVGFFVCENRAQHLFWKPEFQQHANGADVISSVHLASSEPERDAAFIAAMFDGACTTISGGMSVACGPGQDVRVLTPHAIAEIDPTYEPPLSAEPILAGLSVRTSASRPTISSAEGCGMFIAWETAQTE
ncbi:MAG: VOC family protein [Pseudomonadota bacterium]